MLNLALQPSRILLCVIVSSHLLALAAVWLSALPFYLCLLIDGLVMISAYRQMSKHIWVGKRHLSFTEGQWILRHQDQGEKALSLELQSEFYFSPWMIVLNFCYRERDRDCDRENTKILDRWINTQTIVILPDSVEADVWRQLRVFLRNIPQPKHS